MGFSNSFKKLYICPYKLQQIRRIASSKFVKKHNSEIPVNLVPDSGHNILILQPNLKFKKSQSSLDLNFPEEALQLKGPSLDEAVSLINSLEKWKIAHKLEFKMKHNKSQPTFLFTKGIKNNVYNSIHQLKLESSNKTPITAIFLNWSKVSNSQMLELQMDFGLPVFDRFALVVQIFKQQSRTHFALLHSRIAELAIIRSRIPIMQFHGHKNLSYNKFNQLKYLKVEIENQIIDEETKCHAELNRVNPFRLLDLKNNSTPRIAVIGYTNAGKTSFMRRITKKKNLAGSQNVFATLDVTRHKGNILQLGGYGDPHLGPGLKAIFSDTIGFMADLPSVLFPAFRETLKECLNAHVILHIIDIYDPMWKIKLLYVEHNLKKSLNDDLSGRIVRIGNKIDLISEVAIENFKNEGLLDVLLSISTGAGLENLFQSIHQVLSKYWSWKISVLDIDMQDSEDILKWLYENTMILSLDQVSQSNQYMRVKVSFSPKAWSKFVKIYSATKF